MKQSKQSGFTIIELMIATVVFSVILIVLTAGLLYIGRTYYKGINQAKVQDDARTVVDDVVQSVEFSGSLPTSGQIGSSNVYYYCMSNTLYRYVLHLPEKDDPAGNTNGILSQPFDCSKSPNDPVALANPTALWPNGDRVQLLGINSRLVKFDIVPQAPNMYQVTIGLVTADNVINSDLVCSPSTSGDCTGTGPTTAPNATDLTCKTGNKGDQYCATSEISTTVQRRLN